LGRTKLEGSWQLAFGVSVLISAQLLVLWLLRDVPTGPRDNCCCVTWKTNGEKQNETQRNESRGSVL